MLQISKPLKRSWQQRANTILTLLVLIHILSACSKPSEPGMASVQVKELGAQSTNRYLAYQHQVGLEVEAERIAPLTKQLQENCAAAQDDHCEILESQLNTGRFSVASLKFRASPSGVRKFMKELEKLGTIIDQTTSAEDLAGPIADTSKQRELLLDYRQRLEGLRERAKTDIDALIKVNKELAQVQNEIEALNGKFAQLKQRVDTETLTVKITSRDQTSTSGPIKSALLDFGNNLAYACASAITGIAYLLPWSVVLFIFFLILRRVWRWMKAKSLK